MSVGCCPDEFVWHQENKNISSKSQRDVSLLKKILASRNELRESENIGARDLDVLITSFLLQVREFLFLICVKPTISMKILVLRVINSSRHRNRFVRGYIHSLFVSKALTRSYLARSGFTQTTREYNPARRTFYDVNCIYSPGGGTLGISGWGCAARTLEPLACTRASFSWILLPYTRVNSPNHRFPSEFRFLTVNNIQ